MQNRPQGEWSLHAQVTFSHGGGPAGQGAAATTASVQPTVTSFSNGSGGVRMEYSFKTHGLSPEPPAPTPPPTQHIPSGYGFQRGNILFTTRPPQRGTRSHSFHFTGADSSSTASSTSAPRASTLGRSTEAKLSQDSGYNSEQLSPHSYGSLPSRSRPTQVYNRRCMSTYSIVLADARTAVPNSAPARPAPADFSPVPEVCEECAKTSPPRIRSPHPMSSPHLCSHVQAKKTNTAPQGELKDAASQTVSDPNSPTNMKPTQPKMGSKIYNARRKTDADVFLQVPLLHLPEAETPEDKTKSSRRLARSPARLGGKSPLLQKRAPALDSPDSISSVPSVRHRTHRPRTVHIDVYCTGSDDDADASDTSSTCSSNTTTPQTVFESDKVRVVHSRPKKYELPLMYSRKQKIALSRKSESFKFTSVQKEIDTRGYESDEGTLSSLYPSRSSFDSIDICLPSGPSRDASWSALSSSTLLFEDDTSSWKDTTESGADIRESTNSLAQSDSFEYADSVDRLRIHEKEEAWSNLHPAQTPEHESKTWRSPESERRHMLQQQRYREFLTKHLNKVPHWSANSTTSSNEESWEYTSEDGSHFGLKREDTVRRASSPLKLLPLQSDSLPSMQSIPSIPSRSSYPSMVVSDSGSLSDCGLQYSRIHETIGPFGRRPPVLPPPKHAINSTSPFTTPQGIKTKFLSDKFGPMVGSLKKPGGNHIGPSKNPECGCDHCRRYYEDSSFRERACSVGDVPRGVWQPDEASVNPTDINTGQPSL